MKGQELRIKRLIVGPLLTNCYLVLSKNEALIIDPGGDIDNVLKKIQKRKLKYIINTHYHPDHTAGNKKLKEKTGARILIHKKEKDFISFRPDKFLKEGDKIKIGDGVLKVLYTPGHTKGSICLLGDSFIFTGDTLFKDGIGRTDLPGGSEKAMKNSLFKISKLLKANIIAYPGHGEVFKINE